MYLLVSHEKRKKKREYIFFYFILSQCRVFEIEMKKYTTINNQSFSQAFLKNNNNNHLAEPTYDMPFNDCKIKGTVLLVQHNITTKLKKVHTP